MKCLSCDKKLTIKNIQRLCKKNDDHVYCKECIENKIKNLNEKEIILCKDFDCDTLCDSIIYQKNIIDINEEKEKINLGIALLASHLSLISSKIN